MRPRPANCPTLAAALALLACAAAPSSAKDARPAIVALQLAGDTSGALNELHAALRADPTAARGYGLLYLRGHLLERLGRTREAADAFAASLAGEPTFASYARLRLARVQDGLGHPEVAAGLAAQLLAAASTPAALIGPATKLLVDAVARGGECRLLQSLRLRALPAEERRALLLAAADCAARQADPNAAAAGYLALLEESTEDDVALSAAEGLAANPAESSGEDAERLLGLTLYRHREFERAIPFLERALRNLTVRASPELAESTAELTHALGRCHFWQGRYRAAAAMFAELARRAGDPLRAQDAFYQQARSEELLGDWRAAEQLFRRAAAAVPAGELAPLALFSALRLEWRAGREEEGLAIYEALRRDRRYRVTAGRAALFLAASDLVRGRVDRAGTWLASARAAGAPAQETAYWFGRRAEAQGNTNAAIAAHLEAMLPDPGHPLAVAAAGRLSAPLLADGAYGLGLRLAATGDAPSQLAAWLLLGDSPAGRRAHDDLLRLLANDRRTAPFVRISVRQPAEWPIYYSLATATVESRMLALGLAAEGGPSLLRHFPPDNPWLLVSGGRLMLAGGQPRRAIYAAEVLLQRVPARVPRRALAEDFRRLLYPLPHAAAIHRESQRQGIDPHLLTAILREESRFDATAISPASARGMAQFTLPTARRVAAQLGRPPLTPRELEDPELSVALAARYLANLGGEFVGSPPRIVAAYNAGEAQARLWRSYCFSDDDAEYFTKVTFKETRAYLARVLGSREEYAVLAAR